MCLSGCAETEPRCKSKFKVNFARAPELNSYHIILTKTLEMIKRKISLLRHQNNVFRSILKIHIQDMANLMPIFLEMMLVYVAIKNIQLSINILVFWPVAALIMDHAAVDFSK